MGAYSRHFTPSCILLYYFQDAGVRRIAVGIGNEIHYGELLEIAGNREDVLQVHSYRDLINKLEDIMRLACDDQYPGKQKQTNKQKALGVNPKVLGTILRNSTK